MRPTDVFHSFASRYSSGEALDETAREEILSDIVRFAARKLIACDVDTLTSELNTNQELACLSARLPIEFITPTEVSDTSTQAERDQVAHHLRICLSAGEGYRKLQTLCPSEPIVSEGAYLVMTNEQVSFYAPLALSSVLSDLPVVRDDHGKLVGLLALTMARDNAVK